MRAMNSTKMLLIAVWDVLVLDRSAVIFLNVREWEHSRGIAVHAIAVMDQQESLKREMN